MPSEKSSERVVYNRAYSAGYAAGRRRVDNVAQFAAPVEVATVSAQFYTPGGRRIALQLPNDVTADDLDFFDEALPQYLALYRKRLAKS